MNCLQTTYKELKLRKTKKEYWDDESLQTTYKELKLTGGNLIEY